MSNAERSGNTRLAEEGELEARRSLCLTEADRSTQATKCRDEDDAKIEAKNVG